MTVTIPIQGPDVCSRDYGAEVRRAIIKNIKGGKVTLLDMSEVVSATHGFLDESLGVIISMLGPERTLDLVKVVANKNVTKMIAEVMSERI